VCVFSKIEDCEGGVLTCMVALFLVNMVGAPFNPLLVQFKALLHGQKGCVFFSGHLNLRTAPETGLPSREKNHNN